MNSLLVIHPYKHDGVWVFDDPAVGLGKEPFVAGAEVLQFDVGDRQFPPASGDRSVRR
jgi:hypothetical protein